MKERFKKKFPQINRIITAIIPKIILVSKTMVFCMIILISIFSIHTLIFPDNQEYIKLKVETLNKPNDFSSYTALALYFSKHGLIDEANNNFALAQNYYLLKESKSDSEDVLGKQTSPFNLYQQIKERQKTSLEEINYWQNITLQKPQFRDAYLQIGILSYNLGLFDQSRQAFNKALQIDPLFPDKDNFKGFLD